jgi:hypothetical protein
MSGAIESHEESEIEAGSQSREVINEEATVKERRSQNSLGLTLIALAFASACAPQVTVTPLGDQRTYPPTPDSVAIPLHAITKPECPYDEIAAITTEGADEGAVLSALIARARAVGAHAILGYTQSTRMISQNTDGYVRGGTAIRYRSPDCMK